MKTPLSNKTKNSKLTALDAGFTFTASSLSILLFTFLFSLAIVVLALSKGASIEEYTEALNDNFLYTVFSYLLSSVALLIAILASSVYAKQKPFAPIPFKKTHYKYWIISGMLALGLLFGFNELNNLFISFLEKIGYNAPGMILPNDEWWQYLVWIIVACALPAFFEECVFRGYILEGLKGFSTVFIVIVGGLAFSIFHQNPQQTPYQFVCGATYFFLGLKCGSILPCMAMHFINNFIVITFDYLKVSQFSPALTITLTILGIVCFILALVYLIFFDKKPDRTNEYLDKDPVKHTKTRFFIMALVGFATCAVMWIINLISYMGG